MNDEKDLGAKARREIERALREDRLLISATSFWEVAILVSKERIEMYRPVHQWRLDVLRAGIEEIPLDGELVIQSVALAGLHGDPADRFIAATAIKAQATLVTSDARLLAWKGPLACIDARV